MQPCTNIGFPKDQEKELRGSSFSETTGVVETFSLTASFFHGHADRQFLSKSCTSMFGATCNEHIPSLRFCLAGGPFSHSLEVGLVLVR